MEHLHGCISWPRKHNSEYWTDNRNPRLSVLCFKITRPFILNKQTNREIRTVRKTRWRRALISRYKSRNQLTWLPLCYEVPADNADPPLREMTNRLLCFLTARKNIREVRIKFLLFIVKTYLLWNIDYYRSSWLQPAFSTFPHFRVPAPSRHLILSSLKTLSR